MTTERVLVNAGSTCFHELDGEVAAANTSTTDLRSIVDTVDVPIVVIRPESVIAFFNKAAVDVLGLSPLDIGRPSDISMLAGVPRLKERCSQVIASGVDFRVDVRQGDRVFLVRISPYICGDRQVTGTVLTFTDMTAFRASIEQAIYERECTKAILNTVVDPLVVLSADQRIQSGNRAFYTMFGLSRDQTQGVPLYDLGNGAFDLAPLRQQIIEMLANDHAFQPVEVDHAFTARGQRTVLLDAHLLSFPGHSEHRVLVTFHDITARKQAEVAKDLRSDEELRRSEAFLAEGQRLSSTGSFSWMVPTDEIIWSEQLYRIFEFDPGTPVTIERINSRVHPEDMPMVSESIERARAGDPDFEYAPRLLMPDGSVKYVNAIAHRSGDAEGRLEYIGAVQDVTQRRMSEEALERARSELSKIARVTSLGVLTASIAHEVNQPLSGIITNASTCLRMLDADPPNVDGARETARRTIRDGGRASDVITRLRALYSKKEFTFELLDVNEVTMEVIALSLSDLQRNRVALQSDLAEDIPAITGDRIQLQQVILNLLRNASDAMLDVHDRPRHLLVKTEREDGDRVRVSVRDAGVGVDPQSMNTLFDTFYTTKTDGMGIGLSISRSIIEGHQGRLWAEPNDGPGTTFSFSIPTAPRARRDARATTS
jgi:PAS domain S-box-containing protein